MTDKQKASILLLAILMFAGCSKPGDAESKTPEKPQVDLATGNASPEPDVPPPDAADTDRVYAKGVVILKTGEKVAGQILLQCGGYLTVCFKVNSSDPDSSQLVAIEDVERVLLEESIDDVDPYWRDLQKEMAVTTTESPAGDSQKAASEKQRSKSNQP